MLARITAVLFLLVLSFSALADDPLAQLDPPATEGERAMYQEIKDDPARVSRMLSTRSYVRRYQADPKAAGHAPKDFDFEYMLDFDEQMFFFKLVTAQEVEKAGLTDELEHTREALRKEKEGE